MSERSVIAATTAVNTLAGLVFGWLAVGVNTAAGLLWPCLYGRTFEDDEWLRSGLQAIVNVGAMIGALASGHLTDRFGFRRSISSAGVISLAAIWSAFAGTYGEQYGARFILGLGVGVLSCAAPTYVSQMSPRRMRGFIGCLFQVSVTMGILAANLTGYFLLGDRREDDIGDDCDHNSIPCSSVPVGDACDCYCLHNDDDFFKERNRNLMIPGICFAGVIAVVGLLIPESATWVQAQYATIGEFQGDRLSASALPPRESNPDIPSNRPSSVREVIATCPRACALGVVGAVALQLTGINAVMFYGAKFFDAADYDQKVLGAVIIMAWNFVTTLGALLLVERLGRRKLLVPSLFVISAAWVVLPPVFGYVDDDTTKAVLCFVCLGFFIAAFECGPGTLFWVVCNEIFPENAAPVAFSMINGLQWVFTLIVTFTFPPLESAMDQWVFWIFAFFGIVSAVFHLFALPETKDRTRAEIQADLNARALAPLLFGGAKVDDDDLPQPAEEGVRPEP